MEKGSYKGIIEEIELVRKSMIVVGMKFGLTHPETVELSKKLDELLNDFTLYEHCTTA